MARRSRKPVTESQPDEAVQASKEEAEKIRREDAAKSWKEHLDMFHRSTLRLSEKTQQFYRCQLRQLEAWCVEQCITVHMFRYAHYLEYETKRRTVDKVSPQTCVHDMRAASRFFAFLFEMGYVSPNPLNRCSVPPVPEQERIIPTDDDLDRLLRTVIVMKDPAETFSARFQDPLLRKALTRRYRAILALLIASACRIGELLQCERRHLDIERAGEMSITFTRTKTGRIRTVPLPESIRPILEEYLRHSDSTQKFLFYSQTGQAASYASFSRFYRSCRDAAKLPPFRLHDLRHRTASKIAKINVVAARDTLGHRNLQTTNRYVHSTDAERREAMEKADATGGIFRKPVPVRERRKRIL